MKISQYDDDDSFTRTDPISDNVQLNPQMKTCYRTKRVLKFCKRNAIILCLLLLVCGLSYSILTTPRESGIYTGYQVDDSFFRKDFVNPLAFDDIKEPIIPRETYIPLLQISCTLYDPDHLSIIITDAERPRYEIPLEEPYPYPKNPTFPSLEESNFDIVIETAPFKLQVIRRSTKEVIFDFDRRLIYTDLYIEFSFTVPTNNLYGFGQRLGTLQYKSGTYTLFILDRSGEIEKGIPGYNAQGHHPMYLNREKSGLYHVMFLRSGHAQEIVIDDNKLTWKIIGGVIDLNFFLGKTPEAVLERFHSYLGGWALPALWHLGSHQCKWWSYFSKEDLEYVLQGYESVKVPLDALWADVEIYKGAVTFLVNEEKYPPSAMKQMYKDYRKRFITVGQSYIPLQPECPVWQYPNVTSLAMRDGKDTSKPYLGGELSGHVYFVDYRNPESQELWNMLMDGLREKLPVSGIWADANEPTNFFWMIDMGGETEEERIIKRDQEHSTRKYYHLPFYPGGVNFYSMPVVALDAVHYDGEEEYNVRSFNCLYQSIRSFKYFRSRGFAFPFVLSRATIFGIGKYAYHFIPDSASTWRHIKATLSTLMNLNIYGIPMVGADICGMGGDVKTPPELCARWYQVAAFYPFARNHHSPLNDYDNFQEPYRYSGIYLQAIRDAVLLRYSILKQFQTLFFLKKQVGTIFRPFFIEFFDEKTLPPFGDITHEEQFLLADMLMSTPVLDENATNVTAYFPNCRWYDLRNYQEVPVRGQKTTISAKIEEGVPHFLRGGHILFQQDVQNVMISEDLSNTFKLIVGLDDFIETPTDRYSKATGYILDAISPAEDYVHNTCVRNDCMLKASLTYYEDLDRQIATLILSVESMKKYEESDTLKMDELYILGAAAGFRNLTDIICLHCPVGSSILQQPLDKGIRLKLSDYPLKDGVMYAFELSYNAK